MHMAYVDWNRLSAECHPEEEKDYLVVFEDEGDACYNIAKWYNKGSKVHLERTPEAVAEAKKNRVDMTPEEQLLTRIFGDAGVTVEIPESGFWKITKDCGTDEKNYPGCAEILVDYGTLSDTTRIFWAELPIEPEGLRHPYDAKREHDMVIEQIRQEKQEELEVIKEERERVLQDAITEGGLVDRISHTSNAADTWRNVIKDATITGCDGNQYENAVAINDVVFHTDEHEKNLIIAGAAQAVETILEIRKMVTDDEIVKAYSRGRAGDTKEYYGIFQKIETKIREMDRLGLCNKRNGRYEKMVRYALLDTPFYHAGGRGRQFWHKRLNHYDWFKSLPLTQQIVLNTAFYEATTRLRRCLTVYSMEAPEIILRNEFRILYEWFFVLMETPVGYMDDFASTYGYSVGGEYVPADEEEASVEEDDNTPPFPDDLPQEDELGDPIPYMYNKETGKWEDQRTEGMIEETKATGKQIRDTVEKVAGTVKGYVGQEFADVNALIAKLKEDTGFYIYVQEQKNEDHKLVERLSVDIGLYDCVVPVCIWTDESSIVLKPVRIGCSAKDADEMELLPDCMKEAYHQAGVRLENVDPFYSFETN